MFLERKILGRLQVGQRHQNAPVRCGYVYMTPPVDTPTRTHTHTHTRPTRARAWTHVHTQGEKALQFNASRGAMQLQEEVARIG